MRERGEFGSESGKGGGGCTERFGDEGGFGDRGGESGGR